MAVIHRSRQFGRGVVSDGLGLAVGFLVSKARFSGGYFNRFLSSNFRKILRKFQKAALILARQIRPLPLAKVGMDSARTLMRLSSALSENLICPWAKTRFASRARVVVKKIPHAPSYMTSGSASSKSGPVATGAGRGGLRGWLRGGRGGYCPVRS